MFNAIYIMMNDDNNCKLSENYLKNLICSMNLSGVVGMPSHITSTEKSSILNPTIH